MPAAEVLIARIIFWLVWIGFIVSAIDTLPAVWLIATSLVLDHPSAATPYHNAIVAALVIFASTTPLVAFPTPEELGAEHHA